MLSMNVEFCERLVATLAHSLWQGLLTGIILIVATTLLRSRGPEIRHAIAVICLAMLVLCLPLTFVLTAPQKLRDFGGSVHPPRTVRLSPICRRLGVERSWMRIGRPGKRDQCDQ